MYGEEITSGFQWVDIKHEFLQRVVVENGAANYSLGFAPSVFERRCLRAWLQSGRIRTVRGGRRVHDRRSGDHRPGNFNTMGTVGMGMQHHVETNAANSVVSHS